MAENSLTINQVIRLEDSGISRAVFKSDSMEPTIRGGDVIEVDHTNHKYSGDGIYCFAWSDRFGDALILRRVIRQVDGSYDLMNDNDLYPHQRLTEAELAQWPMRGRVMRSYSASTH